MRNRKRYPSNWRKKTKAMRESVGNRCERCGVAHGTPRVSVWTGNEYRVWLQCAHINHDPENEDAELAVVCPSCHWHFFRRKGSMPSWYFEKRKHRILLKRDGHL